MKEGDDVELTLENPTPAKANRAGAQTGFDFGAVSGSGDTVFRNHTGQCATCSDAPTCGLRKRNPAVQGCSQITE